MSTSLNPESVELNLPNRNNYGPSDNSDSASDVIGTAAETSDSDAEGTGERSSVENTAPSETERDIELDKIIRPAANADETNDENDEDSEENIASDETGDDIESDADIASDASQSDTTEPDANVDAEGAARRTSIERRTADRSASDIESGEVDGSRSTSNSSAI